MISSESSCFKDTHPKRKLGQKQKGKQKQKRGKITSGKMISRVRVREAGCQERFLLSK